MVMLSMDRRTGKMPVSAGLIFSLVATDAEMRAIAGNLHDLSSNILPGERRICRAYGTHEVPNRFATTGLDFWANSLEYLRGKTHVGNVETAEIIVARIRRAIRKAL
jgi:hypothetical protein